MRVVKRFDFRLEGECFDQAGANLALTFNRYLSSQVQVLLVSYVSNAFQLSAPVFIIHEKDERKVSSFGVAERTEVNGVTPCKFNFPENLFVVRRGRGMTSMKCMMTHKLNDESLSTSARANHCSCQKCSPRDNCCLFHLK